MFSRISRRVFGIAAVLTLAVSIPFGIVLAAHFSDVPNSNPFHADIQALADSGVTTGCGGGNFCPSDFVTREQMAAFMNRLGALAPGKIPVVNADKVDGLHANDLVRAGIDAAGGSTTITALWPTFQDTDASVTITAPTAGFVVVNAASTFVGSGSCPCSVISRIRDTVSGTVSAYIDGSVGIGGATTTDALSPTHVFGVSAGARTFTLQVATDGPASGPSTFNKTITALFVPFGSGGGGTLDVTEIFDEVPSGTTSVDPQ